MFDLIHYTQTEHANFIAVRRLANHAKSRAPIPFVRVRNLNYVFITESKNFKFRYNSSVVIFPLKLFTIFHSSPRSTFMKCLYRFRGSHWANGQLQDRCSFFESNNNFTLHNNNEIQILFKNCVVYFIIINIFFIEKHNIRTPTGSCVFLKNIHTVYTYVWVNRTYEMCTHH